MKNLIASFVLLTALYLSGISPLFSQNFQELYQKALIKEEGEGSLLEAIDIYNQIVEDKNADLLLQAKSLLHVGFCYEKLGKDEATKAYRRLVNNFPGQKSEVAIARERLTRLMQITEKVSNAPLIPKFTNINIPTKLSWYVKLSPDGKELAVVSDKKLWKMPLSGNLGSGFSGTPVQLNTEGIEVDHQAGLSWSDDGTWIAFNDLPLNDTLLQKKGQQCIYVVPAEGGKPTKVIENFRAGRVENFRISLSPNGKTLAHSSFTSKEQHVYTTPVAGGSPKQLVEIQAREPIFSPNGKWIAYVEDKNLGTGGGNLWIVPAIGGEPKLIARAGYVTSPVWSPDNSMIAFVDNDKKNQINLVEVPKEGKETGEIISIDAPEGMGVDLLAGWTADNKIGAVLTTKREDAIYSLPVRGGVATKVLHNCWAMMPRWSPDGKNIYYTSSEIEGSQKAFQLSLASVPADGGTGKFLTKDKDEKIVWQLGNQGGNRISPDGKTIVSSAWQEMIPDINFPLVNIWKIATDGSKSEKITNKKDQYFDFSPSWSPDGSKIAFIRDKIKRTRTDFLDTTRITTINSAGGEEKVLVTVSEKWINSLVWSPDGKMLAYLSQEKEAPHDKQINLINAENGTSMFRWEVPSAHVGIELSWSPDSRRIVFNDDERKVIKVMTVSNGNIEEINTNLENVEIGHIDWSPNGEKFVFTGSKEETRKFWFMEDFLPLEELAQNETVEAAREPEGIRIRQISKEPYLDDLGTVSSDGKYLSCVDWGKGDLAIRDLSSNEKQILTDNATLEEDPQKFVIGSAISKNGKLIAYSWWRPYHSFDLHIFDLESNSSRLIYKEEGVEAYPVAWLSDSKLIVIRQNRNNETTQMSLFDVFDGSFQNVKSIDNRTWAQICTSPDENYIAYSTTRKDEGNSDILMLSADGKYEVPLVIHPSNDKVIGWFPGGEDFLFISDRSGTWDLWTQLMAKGKPVGEAKRLYTEIGDVAPIGITEAGDCFFGFSKRSFNAYKIPVDETTGKLDEKPGKPLAGSIFSINWSPDGQYMACVEMGDPSMELLLRNTNNGNEQRLAEELLYTVGPSWASDGKSIYVFGFEQRMLQTKGYKGGIYEVDIKSGIATEILAISSYEFTPSVDDALPISGHVVSTDERYIYLLFQNDWIVKHDLNTGKGTILYRHPYFERGVLQLSPDDKRLLFAVKNKGEEKSRLVTINTNGSDEKEVCTSQEAEISGSAFWSPDGTFIYFSERPEGTNLWRVNSEGGKPEKVWHTDKRAESFSLHPAGKEISYTVRERTTEIRVIEGLIQELEKIYSKKQ